MAANTKLKVTEIASLYENIDKLAVNANKANKLIMKGHYDEAIVLLRQGVKQSPDCHYYWTELSSAYYEKKNYKQAITCIQEALAIKPSCPIVQWHYAGALYGTANKTNGNLQKCYDVYRKILKKGVGGLDKMVDCNEGHNYNLGLISDCRFKIAQCSYEMKDYKKAKRWVGLFIQKFNKNGICPLKSGQKLLLKLAEKINE